MNSEGSNGGASPHANPRTAGDIMTTDVVCVAVGTRVRDVAQLMLEKRVSAVPVLGVDGAVVGMVSEGDLLGREDADRIARRDWWLALVKDGKPLAHPLDTLTTRPVERVMSAPVITIEAQAPLHEIAQMLGAYDIKRLPVMRDGRMVGLVSRSDLVRAMASRAPPPATGRSPNALLAMIAGLVGGAAPRVDTPDRAAVDIARPAVTAAEFRSLVIAHRQAEREETIAAEAQAERKRKEAIEALLDKHVDPRTWANLVEGARLAAASGQKSFVLIRFPCDLCSDGGRKIDVAEPDWPATLRGEAAEIYARWEHDLRTAGFGLRAQITEYLDGIPSKIALSLTWRD